MTTGERGFTLVELLVSLAITGAAAGLLVAALGTGGRVAAGLEGGTAAGETVAAAQEMLRDRIERLLPDDEEAGGGAGNTVSAGRPVTAGTATRFAWVGPAALNRPGTGRQRYGLALGPEGRLALSAADAGDAAGSGARPRWDALIGDVAALDLAYYGPPPSGGLPGWQATWLNRPDPPQLLRVRLRFADGDPRRWPDLVVRPAATVSTACVLDFNTGTCRAP